MIITGTFCFGLKKEFGCLWQGNMDAPDFICTGKTSLNKSTVLPKPYPFQHHVVRFDVKEGNVND